MTRLLALQVCLPITRLLILLLRNHGFWIAEQSIILHLILNVNLSTGSTAPISFMGTIKFNDNITLKDVLCVPSFNLNLIVIVVSFLLHMVAFCRTWLRGGWLARVNNTQAYTTCPLFQTKLTHLKFQPTLIYDTSASDILLRRVYNLHLPYYLSVKISFSFIIIVVFIPKLNR